MRAVCTSVIVVLLAVSIASAELPSNLDDFKAQIAEKAKDPKGAAKLWFDAVFVYTTVDKALGRDLITAMTKDKDWPGTMTYFVSALDEKPYIWRSYIKGATPDNKYAMDANEYEVMIQSVDTHPFGDYPEGKVVKLVIASSGADTPRPMFLEANKKGEYKAREFSSLCVGVRPPVEAVAFGDDMPQSTDPLWVWKYWLQGMLKYCAGQEEAGQAQMFALMKDPDLAPIKNYGALAPNKQYIWRSYVKGTKVDDGYAVPDVNRIEVAAYLKAPVADGAKRVNVWVKTTGGNLDRPVPMERDTRGQWRITDFSSVSVGLQKVPADPKKDDF